MDAGSAGRQHPRGPGQSQGSCPILQEGGGLWVWGHTLIPEAEDTALLTSALWTESAPCRGWEG